MQLNPKASSLFKKNDDICTVQTFFSFVKSVSISVSVDIYTHCSIFSKLLSDVIKSCKSLHYYLILVPLCCR